MVCDINRPLEKYEGSADVSPSASRWKSARAPPMEGDVKHNRASVDRVQGELLGPPVVEHKKSQRAHL